MSDQADTDGLTFEELAAAVGLCTARVQALCQRAIRRLWQSQVNPRVACRRRGRTSAHTDAAVQAALTETDWNLTQAGALLGLSRSAIRSRIRQRGWTRPTQESLP